MNILDLMEEYLDVVDENNKPTGAILTRREVHKKYLWHRCVNVHLFREKKGTVELLTHKRSNTVEWNHGKWDPSFGGHMLAGEKVINAVVREVHDEIGVKLDPLRLIEGPFYKRTTRQHNKFTQKFYYLVVNNNWQYSFIDGEVAEVKWRSLEDIEKSMRENPEKWTTKLENFNIMAADLKKRQT